ncbi:MAG TPA: hypothetical protein PKB10_10925 [Tepidisphaeraceae bacterium]|nr:hypothetical protein [Tepidisphaeraceae bacterium]
MRSALHILLALLVVCANTICLCTVSMSMAAPMVEAPAPVSCCAPDRPADAESPSPGHPVDCDTCNLHRSDGVLSAFSADYRPADAAFLFALTTPAWFSHAVEMRPPAIRGLDPPPRSPLDALALLGRFVL